MRSCRESSVSSHPAPLCTGTRPSAGCRSSRRPRPTMQSSTRTRPSSSGSTRTTSPTRRDTAEMQPRCSRDTAEIWSRCGRSPTRRGSTPAVSQSCTRPSAGHPRNIHGAAAAGQAREAGCGRVVRSRERFRSWPPLLSRTRLTHSRRRRSVFGPRGKPRAEDNNVCPTRAQTRAYTARVPSGGMSPGESAKLSPARLQGALRVGSASACVSLGPRALFSLPPPSPFLPPRALPASGRSPGSRPALPGSESAGRLISAKAFWPGASPHRRRL